MVVKAPLKILTYTGRDPLGQEVREQIKGDMGLYPYHNAGEEYIFVGFEFGFCKAHRYVVPRDGVQARIILEPVYTDPTVSL
jgi:hypothetical protein